MMRAATAMSHNRPGADLQASSHRNMLKSVVRTKLWVGLLLAPILAACTHAPVGGKTNSSGDRLLDLISESVRAANSGRWEDEKSVVSSFGGSIIGVLIHGDSMEAGTPKRLSIAIPEFDDSPRGVSPTPTAHFSLRRHSKPHFRFVVLSIPRTLCISPDDIRERFGKPYAPTPAHHSDRYGQGGWQYVGGSAAADSKAKFGFIRRPGEPICLESFSVEASLK